MSAVTTGTAGTPRREGLIVTVFLGGDNFLWRSRFATVIKEVEGRHERSARPDRQRAGVTLRQKLGAFFVLEQ